VRCQCDGAMMRRRCSWSCLCYSFGDGFEIRMTESLGTALRFSHSPGCHYHKRFETQRRAMAFRYDQLCLWAPFSAVHCCSSTVPAPTCGMTKSLQQRCFLDVSAVAVAESPFYRAYLSMQGILTLISVN